MAAPKNKTPEERELQLQKVLDGWNNCLTQQEIALTIGVSRVQVAYDLKILFQRFRDDTKDKLHENRFRELARLDHLETTAWEAWERSCGAGEKETRESGGTIFGSPATMEKVTKTIESQCGDPRFLEIVRKCIEDRRKIFGIDAPVKQEVGIHSAADVADLIAKGLGFQNANPPG